MMDREPKYRAGANPGSKGWVRRYGELALGILMVLLIIFFVGPWFDQREVMQPMVKFIDERGINANMYFYTEVEEFSEANLNMDNTWAYTPGAKLSKGL